MRLLIARHGQSTWNLEGRYQGHLDPPLSDLGRKQADLLRDRLSREPLTAAYASDLERAWRTAEIIAEEHRVRVHRDAAWRETAYGEWEGLTEREIRTRFPVIWQRRAADPAYVAPPGGETWLEVQQRALAGIERLRARHAGETVLLVTHSGPKLVLGCWLHHVDPNSRDLPHNANAGLSCVDWTGSAPVVEFWSDVSHLES
jgi:broad specificity phosphatase PhoE